MITHQLKNHRSNTSAKPETAEIPPTVATDSAFLTETPASANTGDLEDRMMKRYLIAPIGDFEEELSEVNTDENSTASIGKFRASLIRL